MSVFLHCFVLFMPWVLNTWHGLDVVGRVHGHHFGVYPDAIPIVGIEIFWQLHQRQGRLTIRIEILLEGVGPEVYIAFIHVGSHGGRNRDGFLASTNTHIQNQHNQRNQRESRGDL